MPRCLLGICILLLVPVMCMQAQGDAVLMKVGPDAVSKGEFEYYYRRSSNRDLHLFLQSFIDYRLKVLQAKEEGLDTLDEFRMQKDYYCKAYLSKRPEPKPLRGGREWIKLAHVTFPMAQHAGKNQELRGKQQMDSLYAELKKGADWQTIGEELPWVQTRFLLKEWQEQLARLEKGRVSPPFYSPQGIHLIAWTEKRVSDMTENRPVVTRETDYGTTEVANGLLVAMLDKAERAGQRYSEEGLKAYFNLHREEYGWGMPHFRGMVIHCRDKKEAKAIKKYLRKYQAALWAEAMERMPATVAGKCAYESGFYRIGDNVYVDKLAFKCGGFEPKEGYPYTWVLGEKLKKGPENLEDVRDKVVDGYRKQQKKDRMERLKQKYRVEINEEVLKTVNNEGNK